MLASVEHGKVRLLTRNGHDWTDRLPAVAKAIGQLYVEISEGGWRTGGARQGRHLKLPRPAGRAFQWTRSSPCSSISSICFISTVGTSENVLCVIARTVLKGLSTWHGMLRYSDHQEGDAVRMLPGACE